MRTNIFLLGCSILLGCIATCSQSPPLSELQPRDPTTSTTQITEVTEDCEENQERLASPTAIIPETSQPESVIPTSAQPVSTPNDAMSVEPPSGEKSDSFSILELNPWELVMDVAWSKDGAYLAVSAGNKILLYDAQSFDLVWQVTLPALTHSIAFNNDNVWFAAGSRDGIVRLWRVSDMLAERPAGNDSQYLLIEAHQRGVNSIAFNPSGSLLASGGNDAVVRIWDVTSGELVAELIGGTYAVPGIAFNPDGSMLAILNGDYIRIREIESNLIWGSLRSASNLYSIAYHPAGDQIAAGDIANNIFIWNPAEAFRSGVENYPEPRQVSLSQDGEDSYRSLVWDIVYHPDGLILAGAGGDGVIRLWDVQTMELVREFPGHSAAVTSLAFNPDGSKLATGSLDASVRIWSLTP